MEKSEFSAGGYKLEKGGDLVRCPGKTAIQSLGIKDGVLYAHYDYWTQKYVDGRMVEEIPTELHHPNDCEPYGEDFLMCDTGTKDVPTSLRIIDGTTCKVKATYYLNLEGWRTAASAYRKEFGIVAVCVQAIDTRKRTENLVVHFDPETGISTEIMRFPMHNRFVQGCAFVCDKLVVTTNDGGGSELTRFVKLDLRSKTVVDTVVFSGFGESEGLWHAGSECEYRFITGLNKADGQYYFLTGDGENERG